MTHSDPSLQKPSRSRTSHSYHQRTVSRSDLKTHQRTFVCYKFYFGISERSAPNQSPLSRLYQKRLGIFSAWRKDSVR